MEWEEIDPNKIVVRYDNKFWDLREIDMDGKNYVINRPDDFRTVSWEEAKLVLMKN